MLLVSVAGTDLTISISATSAADCSAAFRLKNPGSESYLVLLTTTVDLKIGSWEGPETNMAPFMPFRVILVIE